MEVLHETEEPGALVHARLLETLPGRGLLERVRDLVLLHAVVCDVPLALVQPAGVKGVVGKEPEAQDGDEGGDGTFEDEEPGAWSVIVPWPVVRASIPSPACDAADVIKAGKDAGGDEAGETSGQNLGAVEHGDAGSNLCTRISLVPCPRLRRDEHVPLRV